MTASITEVAASLIFLLILWLAWLDVVQNTTGFLAPLLWGLALLASFNLLFTSLASLVWGWSDNMIRVARWSVQLCGLSLFAIGAGYSVLGALPLQGGIGFPGGAPHWIWMASLGFAIGWLGLAKKDMLR